MGYTTDFNGHITLDKPLTKEQKTFVAVNEYIDAITSKKAGKKRKFVLTPSADFHRRANKICQIEFRGAKVKKCKDFAKRIYVVKKGLLKAGVPWTDSHANNWGMTKDGKLVAIDIGLTSLALKNKLKVLAGLGMFPNR